VLHAVALSAFFFRAVAFNCFSMSVPHRFGEIRFSLSFPLFFSHWCLTLLILLKKVAETEKVIRPAQAVQGKRGVFSKEFAVLQ